MSNIIDSIRLSGVTYTIQDSGGGGITSGEVQTMIDENISGKTDVSAFTAHTADTTAHTTSAEKSSWNGAVTALGGMTIIKLTQAQYDALDPNYDSNTLYVIVN
jgi:phage tail tape-measure protein